MDTEPLDAAVRLLSQARHVVALTGAGISTRSGIPDFRSPDSGLWEQYDPAEVATIYGFRENPRRFYEWIRPLARAILDAEPNAAHHALARMEAIGRLKCVITQNIDMLHTKAGSQTVYEAHGHLREVTCIQCFSVFPAQGFIHEFLESHTIPCCPVCHDTLKPNVILFGEQLPARVLFAAQREARQCDVMLVAGSSLEVFPAAELPILARRSGASVIIVDLRPTAMDDLADVLIRGDVVDALPRLATALENEEK